jgi:predicted nucleic acid-binding protein
MVVVDTSAWIEWLIGSATARRIEPHLPSTADWVVPTIVQLELVKWLTREVGEERAEQVIAFTQICHVVELDTRLALAAADAARAHKLATADAIVFATAQVQGASLLTCDRHFQGLPDVILVDNRKG